MDKEILRYQDACLLAHKEIAYLQAVLEKVKTDPLFNIFPREYWEMRLVEAQQNRAFLHKSYMQLRFGSEGE